MYASFQTWKFQMESAEMSSCRGGGGTDESEGAQDFAQVCKEEEQEHTLFPSSS